MHSFKAHGRYLLKCAFSPDGQRLVTTSADKTARLWRVGGGPKWECEQVGWGDEAGQGNPRWMGERSSCTTANDVIDQSIVPTHPTHPSRC